MVFHQQRIITVKPSLGDKTFERYKQLVEVNINPRLGPIQMCKLQPMQLAEFGHRANQDKIRKLFGPDYPKFDLVMPLADGTPWAPDDFTDAYIAFSRRISTRDTRFHDLRHTHASELLRRAFR
jgi:hypothetical protein